VGDDLKQQDREQRKQVKDRERKQFARRAQRLASFAAAVDVDGERSMPPPRTSEVRP